MAKTCALCGKTNVAGRRVQHHHAIKWRFRAPKTARMFKPNLKKLNLEVDGTVVKADVCMKCYKRLRKDQEAEAEA